LSDQIDCACDWLDNAHAMLDEHIRRHCCMGKDVSTTAH
jgi:hypothetical protein